MAQMSCFIISSAYFGFIIVNWNHRISQQICSKMDCNTEVKDREFVLDCRSACGQIKLDALRTHVG